MQRNEEKQNDTAKREKVKYKGKESNGRQKEEKREDKDKMRCSGILCGVL